MQGWLILSNIDVDEQDRSLPEAEEANIEPSTTILEKLADCVVFEYNYTTSIRVE